MIYVIYIAIIYVVIAAISSLICFLVHSDYKLYNIRNAVDNHWDKTKYRFALSVIWLPWLLLMAIRLLPYVVSTYRLEVIKTKQKWKDIMVAKTKKDLQKNASEDSSG